MKTYEENRYSVQDDQVLWERHEIRHELQEELKNRPLSEFNKSARELFEQWSAIPPSRRPCRPTGQ